MTEPAFRCQTCGEELTEEPADQADWQCATLWTTFDGTWGCAGTARLHMPVFGDDLARAETLLDQALQAEDGTPRITIGLEAYHAVRHLEFGIVNLPDGEHKMQRQSRLEAARNGILRDVLHIDPETIR